MRPRARARHFTKHAEFSERTLSQKHAIDCILCAHAENRMAYNGKARIVRPVHDAIVVCVFAGFFNGVIGRAGGGPETERTRLYLLRRD